MTSISSLSNFDPQSYLASITPSTAATNGASSEDSSVAPTAAPPERAHHGGHGGHMGRALMETFQQLGMSDDGSASAATSSSTSSTSSDDGSTSSTQSNLGGDLAAFMSQLFQAMRSQVDAGSSPDSSSASTTTDAARGPGRLDSALSSLSTAAANGSAPAGLQSAYDQLLSDLQGGSSSSSSSSSDASAAASSSSSSTPSLQSFLTALQQNLGQAPQNLAVGNVISTQA